MEIQEVFRVDAIDGYQEICQALRNNANDAALIPYLNEIIHKLHEHKCSQTTITTGTREERNREVTIQKNEYMQYANRK